MISGSIYALLAGCLGATASLSAKLTLGADYLKEMCEAGLSSTSDAKHDNDETTVCLWLDIPLRLLCVVLMFLCNAVMWTFFSKALRYSSSSARATATTTGGNFISSAILGRLIFGETQSVLWWVGISLTLCGLLVLHGSTPQNLPQDDAKTE
ncbi:transmembrane protein 42-like [Hippocampus comes]|uniref:Transmembrane protein 42a n=1 Tax=Hippocampus comes TaxID=109280 RepID=A0A3Q2YGN3_HIPCM|nr:PREDICTED: transmembrane protein 42-like [Hippocampus comes]